LAAMAPSPPKASARGPVQLRLDIIESGQDWRIESLSWRYLDYRPTLR